MSTLRNRACGLKIRNEKMRKKEIRMKKVLKTISMMLAAVLMIGMMSLTAFAASVCNHQWATPSGKDKAEVQFCRKCSTYCYHNETTVTHTCKSNYEITKCTLCKVQISMVDKGTKGNHNYVDGVCTNCQGLDPDHNEPCNHTWDRTTYKCGVCGEDCPHEGGEKVNYTCKSTYKTTLCEDCNKVLSTENMGVAAEHNYVSGICTWCNNPEPCATHTWDKTTHKCSVCKVDCPHTAYESYAHNCKSEYDVKRCVDCYYVDPNSRVYTGFGDHKFENGICIFCGKDNVPCEDGKHVWEYKSGIGKCTKCYVWCGDHDLKTTHPDCTEGGYILHKCQFCGYSTIDNTPVEPGNHTYGTDGVCTKCGDACEHKSTKTTNSATCKKDGQKVVTCKICKKVLSVKNVKALGHNYVEGVCTRCGKVYDYRGVVLHPAALDKVPKTGDFSVVMMGAVEAITALGTGVAFARKKKEK